MVDLQAYWQVHVIVLVDITAFSACEKEIMYG